MVLQIKDFSPLLAQYPAQRTPHGTRRTYSIWHAVRLMVHGKPIPSGLVYAPWYMGNLYTIWPSVRPMVHGKPVPSDLAYAPWYMENLYHLTQRTPHGTRTTCTIWPSVRLMAHGKPIPSHPAYASWYMGNLYHLTWRTPHAARRTCYHLTQRTPHGTWRTYTIWPSVRPMAQGQPVPSDPAYASWYMENLYHLA